MARKSFKSASEFRSWLEKNHASERELWVRFFRRGSGRPSITWAEAVDQALCFGWIDGIRKSLDDMSYVNRFTPRKPKSNWSLRNIKRVDELRKLGLMQPSGLQAFEQHDRAKAERYSYEQSRGLDSVYERRFKVNKKAWAFFEEQPPGYRKTAGWWVMSAKQEKTRLRRLNTLIADSESGRRIALLTSPRPR
jgi:uncharacterized protein YdeI (YjbR/CyaY-like superfamily)